MFVESELWPNLLMAALGNTDTITGSGPYVHTMTPAATLRRAVRAVQVCAAQVLKSGSVISFVEGRLVNQEGELVATASSSYLIRERQ